MSTRFQLNASFSFSVFEFRVCDSLLKFVIFNFCNFFFFKLKNFVDTSIEIYINLIGTNSTLLPWEKNPGYNRLMRIYVYSSHIMISLGKWYLAVIIQPLIQINSNLNHNILNQYLSIYRHWFVTAHKKWALNSKIFFSNILHNKWYVFWDTKWYVFWDTTVHTRIIFLEKRQF